MLICFSIMIDSPLVGDGSGDRRAATLHRRRPAEILAKTDTSSGIARRRPPKPAKRAAKGGQVSPHQSITRCAHTQDLRCNGCERSAGTLRPEAERPNQKSIASFVFDYVERFYNTLRRHSRAGNLYRQSPAFNSYAFREVPVWGSGQLAGVEC